MRQLLIKLNLAYAGGNYGNMKRKLIALDADISHWKGQGWAKDEQLKDWTEYSRASTLKPHLIKERGHQCEECKLEEWLNKPITLEVEHVDGNTCNNNLDNLKLLCPNCHSYTPTWRRKKSSL